MEKSIPQDGLCHQAWPLWDLPAPAGARAEQASSHGWRLTSSSRCAVGHPRGGHGTHVWLAAGQPWSRVYTYKEQYILRKKMGLTPSVTGSTSLRCREATEAHGGDDSAAGRCGWSVWSEGEQRRPP